MPGRFSVPQPGRTAAASRLGARRSPRRMASRRQTLPPRNHPGAAQALRKTGRKRCSHTRSHGVLMNNRRASGETPARLLPHDGTQPLQIPSLSGKRRRSAVCRRTLARPQPRSRRQSNQDLAAERPGSVTSSNHCERDVRLGERAGPAT